MKIFRFLFFVATVTALFGMVAIYGASLRKSLMGDYYEIMSAARRGVAEFSPIDD